MSVGLRMRGDNEGGIEEEHLGGGGGGERVRWHAYHHVKLAVGLCWSWLQWFQSDKLCERPSSFFSTLMQAAVCRAGHAV